MSMNSEIKIEQLKENIWAVTCMGERIFWAHNLKQALAKIADYEADINSVLRRHKQHEVARGDK